MGVGIGEVGHRWGGGVIGYIAFGAWSRILYDYHVHIGPQPVDLRFDTYCARLRKVPRLEAHSDSYHWNAFSAHGAVLQLPIAICIFGAGW